MKNLTLILTLIVFTLFANAHSREDMRSGKYFKSGAKNLYAVRWISDESGKDMEILVPQKKPDKS